MGILNNAILVLNLIDNGVLSFPTDGHNDLPWNIKRYSHNRLEYLNFTEGVRSTEPWSNSQWSHTDIPRLRQGLIGAQFW